jgi:hypothetical protein
MQRHQSMVFPLAKAAYPVERRARSGIAHQFGAFGGSGDERTERLEGEGWNAIFDLQRDQPLPGYS